MWYGAGIGSHVVDAVVVDVALGPGCIRQCHRRLSIAVLLRLLAFSMDILTVDALRGYGQTAREGNFVSTNVVFT